MKVIGYVFDQPNGCYQYKYYFEGSLQKISTFILQNRMKCKKITMLQGNKQLEILRRL